MKTSFLLLAVLISSSTLARSDSSVWQMPSPMPAAPSGINPAAFPVPKLDWVQRVVTTNAKAQASAASIKLVFDGDSITDGWQGKGRPVWTERYEKLGAFDFGISGDRTEHVLWRLSQGQVNGLHPKLIALMIGTNNMGGNTAEQITGGVSQIVAEYRKACPDSVILLQAIFPRGESPTDPVRAKIKTVNAALSKLGDDKKVVFVDFGSKFLSPDGTLSKEIMPDFLHPSAEGYKIWADAIQPVIDKYCAAK